MQLSAITRRAGAVIPARAGVPAHYGSSAAELAVCLQTVGLVDRSDLVKIALSGPPAKLAEITERASGFDVWPGGWSLADGTYWCGLTPDRLLALAEPPADPVVERVRDLVPPGVRVEDQSAKWSAIGIVGRAAGALLKTLGVTSNLRDSSPFGPATIGGTPVMVLLQTDRHATVLVNAAAASQVWRDIEAAGRRFGLSYVGAEAQRRFAVHERVVGPAPSLTRG